MLAPGGINAMTGAQLAQVHRDVADVLHSLIDRAGQSTRATALAVVLVRLGYANEREQKLAEETGDSWPRLHDLSGALLRWEHADSAHLSIDDRFAMNVAGAYLRMLAAEVAWVQRA